MDGCLNNRTQEVLNEWYNLFTQKQKPISKKLYKYWNKHITKSGLLETKNNNWKNIILEEFLKNHFIYPKNDYIFNADQLKKLSYPIDSHKLVFINGKLNFNLSNKNIEPWVLTVNNNLNVNNIHNPIQPEMFSYLIEYLSKEIISIKLPTGKNTKKPLYLLYIHNGINTPYTLITSSSFHNLIIENDSNACIIEHFININDYGNFSGSRMYITIGDRAKLHHIKLICQNNVSYHIAHHDINIGRSSNVNSNIFVLFNPKLTHHKTNIQLNHSKSYVYLNSLLFLSKQNTGSINTYLEHNNTDCAVSKQIHKIIADNQSIGIFQGLIKVSKNSINTDGNMINNNLLLHPSSKIYTTPKLEIYSDNVQCSHGSTIGKINSDHLFYLKTRGIPKKDALQMLLYAFSIEVIQKVEHTMLRNIILTNIEHTLTGNTIIL